MPSDASQLYCLVVSPASWRRELVARAGKSAGWSVDRCGAMESAVRLAKRTRAQLIVVDVQAPTEIQWSVLENLAEHVARWGGLLVMACATGGGSEEIRARQLGAWVYVSGAVDEVEMTSVCSDAQQLLRRMSKSEVASPESVCSESVLPVKVSSEKESSEKVLSR